MPIRIEEERGMALVVALLVLFVVLILSAVVMSQAIHQTAQSGYDRSRVQSIAAAEAGLDYFYNYLQTTPASTLGATPVTQTLATAPAAASFTATPTYYNASGAVTTPPFSDTVYPAAALITSTGQTGGQAPRTMQTYVKLTPTYGGFDAAIIAQSSLEFHNNFTLNGNTSNDADIYVNTGNLTIMNSVDVFGGVYVPGGSVTMSGNSTIRQNLSAYGSIVISNPASVGGNVTSSTSSISGSGSIGGNATAGTTITGVHVTGTSSPNTFTPMPVSFPLPQIPWVPSAWTNAGYAIQTFTDCTSARSYILTSPSGNNAVRIAAVCDLNFSNNTSVTLNGDLAIVTDGSVHFTNLNNWTGSAGSVKKLYLIDAYRPGLGCGPPDSYKIETSNNTNFSNLNVFFYSPCEVEIENRNTSFNGQIMAGIVEIDNLVTMNYRPVLVPGAGSITGFKEDIAYIREVLS